MLLRSSNWKLIKVLNTKYRKQDTRFRERYRISNVNYLTQRNSRLLHCETNRVNVPRQASMTDYCQTGVGRKMAGIEATAN